MVYTRPLEAMDALGWELSLCQIYLPEAFDPGSSALVMVKCLNALLIWALPGRCLCA